MAETDPNPCIYVFAGTNGAGKSSVGGARARDVGADYFNPDETAQEFIAANPGMTLVQANIFAWNEGKRLLERAIDERGSFSFETTLGGQTMVGLLEKAIAKGIEVRIWYVGLSSPELHTARVRARVAAGGHPIPEDKIRERYVNSIHNLTRLLPMVTELRVFDNSAETDPHTGKRPQPTLLLHMDQGHVAYMCKPADAPTWAKPILILAMQQAETD